MRFFTPGPSELDPAIPQLLERALKEHIGSISHRSKKFEEIFARVTHGLRTLLDIPKEHQIFFLGSATEAFERIIENCSAHHTFHLVNGSFSERFYGVANELKRDTQAYELPPGHGAYPDKVAVPDGTELICVTQNETSTGVWIPEASIAGIKAKYPDALVAVDIVSSAPISNLDWRTVDCGFFSVQKCFGLPAGLGVIIVSPAALEKSDRLLAEGRSTGSYHSFQSLRASAKKNQTPETPNVLALYLLAGVIERMNAEGIDQIRAENASRAQELYATVDSIAGLSAFVTQSEFRSTTVITAVVEGGSKRLISAAAARGIEIGSGYGAHKDSQIRIANFPMHSRAQFEELLSVIRDAKKSVG